MTQFRALQVKAMSFGVSEHIVDPGSDSIEAQSSAFVRQVRSQDSIGLLAQNVELTPSIELLQDGNRVEFAVTHHENSGAWWDQTAHKSQQMPDVCS